MVFQVNFKINFNGSGQECPLYTKLVIRVISSSGLHREVFAIHCQLNVMIT